MTSYVTSYWQRKEEEYKAVRRSREIYDQVFMRFYSCPTERGLCSEPKCVGWKYSEVLPDFLSFEYWEACSHRKRRGIEARKKDMLPGHIKIAERRLFDWDAYYRNRERRKSEAVKQQILKQSDVLGEQQKSSTCIKCGKDH